MGLSQTGAQILTKLVITMEQPSKATNGHSERLERDARNCYIVE